MHEYKPEYIVDKKNALGDQRPLLPRPQGICNWCEEPIPDYRHGMGYCDQICRGLWKSHREAERNTERNYYKGRKSREEVRTKVNRILFGEP